MLACWLAAGCCLALTATWLAVGWLSQLAAGEAKKLHPRGHTAYNNRLLEAVKYEIYKLKAYKLRRFRKIVR